MLLSQSSGLVLLCMTEEKIMGFPMGPSQQEEHSNNFQIPQNACLASQAIQKQFNLKYLEWLPLSKIFP